MKTFIALSLLLVAAAACSEQRTAVCQLSGDPHLNVHFWAGARKASHASQAMPWGVNWAARWGPIGVQYNACWWKKGRSVTCGVAMKLPNGAVISSSGRNVYYNCDKVGAGHFPYTAVAAGAHGGFSVEVRYHQYVVQWFAHESHGWLNVHMPQCQMQSSHGWCSAPWNRAFYSTAKHGSWNSPARVHPHESYFATCSKVQLTPPPPKRQLLQRPACTHEARQAAAKQCAAAFHGYDLNKCSAEKFIADCADDLCDSGKKDSIAAVFTAWSAFHKGKDCALHTKCQHGVIYNKSEKCSTLCPKPFRQCVSECHVHHTIPGTKAITKKCFNKCGLVPAGRCSKHCVEVTEEICAPKPIKKCPEGYIMHKKNGECVPIRDGKCIYGVKLVQSEKCSQFCTPAEQKCMQSCTNVKSVSQGAVFHCSSSRYRYAVCAVPGLTSVQLVRKVSRSGCTYGHSYGLLPNGAGMWVHHGCRADFRAVQEVNTPVCRSVCMPGDSKCATRCLVSTHKVCADKPAEPPVKPIEKLVKHWYTECLNREGEAQGVHYWTQLILGSKTGAKSIWTMFVAAADREAKARGVCLKCIPAVMARPHTVYPFNCKDQQQTQAPITQAPETQAPQTQAPQTKAPETQAPETQAPQTKAPETQAPETKAPETQATHSHHQTEQEQKTAELPEKQEEAEEGQKAQQPMIPKKAVKQTTEGGDE